MSVERAIKKLGSRSVSSRRSAAEQLVTEGLSSPEAIPEIARALTEAVKDENEGVSRTAGHSLYVLCQKQPSRMVTVLPHLLGALGFAMDQGGNPSFESYNPFTSIVNGLGFVGAAFPTRCTPAAMMISRSLNFPIYHPENPKGGLDQLYTSGLRTLGVIGALDPRAVAKAVFFMVRCMGDSHKYRFFKAQNPNDPLSMRYAATHAVEAVASSSPPMMIPHLVTSLNDTEPEVSGYAHELLKHLFRSKTPDQMIPPVLICTADEKPQIQEKARELLVEWGSASPDEVIPYLMGSFQNPDRFIRIHSAYVLGEIARTHPDRVGRVLPSMVHYMRNDPDKSVRQNLADAVFKLGGVNVQQVMPFMKEFTAALGDEYHHVRWRTAQVIGLIGQRDPHAVRGAIPTLLEMYRDPHEHVRWKAEEAVKACGIDRSDYLMASKGLEQVRILLEDNMGKNISSREEADLLGQAHNSFDRMDYKGSIELLERSKELIVAKMNEYMTLKKASHGVGTGSQLPAPFTPAQISVNEPPPAPPQDIRRPSDATRFCPYCGTENNADYNFCMNCKKRLPDE